MSILDTFTILFNSNSEQVEKGAAAATAAGKKLETELGNVDRKGVEAGAHIAESNSRLAESFDVVREHGAHMAEKLIEHAFEVAAAFKAIFEVEKLVDNFFEQAEKSDQLGEMSKQLGISVEDLDMWGNAAKRVGGSAEGFAQSIDSINRRIARATAGGRGLKMLTGIFDQFGVKAIDAHGKMLPLLELLPKLAKGIEDKHMGAQQSGGLLRALGLDAGTIRLIQMGGKELDELMEKQRKLGLITKEDTETAEKFEREWDDVKQLFRNITVALDTEILPILDDLLSAVEGFVEFLRDHKNLVVGFFIALGVAALWASEMFGLLDVAIAVLTSPITLIVAGIIAAIAIFAILYDDVMAFAHGHNSVIGEIAKKWPAFGDAVRAVIAIISDLWQICVEAFGEILAWIRKIPQGIEQWREIFGRIGDFIGTLFESIGNKGKALFDMLPDSAKKAFDDIGSVITAALAIWNTALEGGVTALVASLQLLWDTVKAVFKFFADAIVDPMHAFQNLEENIDKGISKFVDTLFPSLVKAWQTVGSEFSGVAASIERVWADLVASITGAIGTITGAVDAVGKKLGGVAGAIGHGADAVGGWLGLRHSAAPAVPGLAAGQAALGVSAATPLAATSSSAIANSNKVVNQTNTVTVAGSTINATSSDPAAIAAAVDSRMNDHAHAAINHLADGVSH